MSLGAEPNSLLEAASAVKFCKGIDIYQAESKTIKFPSIHFTTYQRERDVCGGEMCLSHEGIVFASDNSCNMEKEVRKKGEGESNQKGYFVSTQRK